MSTQNMLIRLYELLYEHIKNIDIKEPLTYYTGDLHYSGLISNDEENMIDDDMSLFKHRNSKSFVKRRIITLKNKCDMTWEDVKMEAVRVCEGHLSMEDFIIHLNDNYEVVKLKN